MRTTEDDVGTEPLEASSNSIIHSVTESHEISNDNSHLDEIIRDLDISVDRITR